jgi:hypothetical protein
MCSSSFFVFFRWLILVSTHGDDWVVLIVYYYTFNKRPCASPWCRSRGFIPHFEKNPFQNCESVGLAITFNNFSFLDIYYATCPATPFLVQEFIYITTYWANISLGRKMMFHLVSLYFFCLWWSLCQKNETTRNLIFSDPYRYLYKREYEHHHEIVACFASSPTFSQRDSPLGSIFYLVIFCKGFAHVHIGTEESQLRIPNFQNFLVLLLHFLGIFKNDSCED